MNGDPSVGAATLQERVTVRYSVQYQPKLHQVYSLSTIFY